MPRVWEKQSFESEPEYAYFWQWLLMGNPRDWTTAAKRAGIGVQPLREMAHRNAWEHRAADYDGHIRSIELAEIEESAKEMRRRHMRANRVAFEAALAELELKQKAGATGEIKAVAAHKIIVESVKLDRLMIGEATERVESGKIDLTRLSDEEFEAYRLLTAKASVE